MPVHGLVASELPFFFTLVRLEGPLASQSLPVLKSLPLLHSLTNPQDVSSSVPAARVFHHLVRHCSQCPSLYSTHVAVGSSPFSTFSAVFLHRTRQMDRLGWYFGEKLVLL